MFIHQCYFRNLNFIFMLTIYSTFNIAIVSYMSYFSVRTAPLNLIYLDVWRYTSVRIIIIMNYR